MPSFDGSYAKCILVLPNFDTPSTLEGTLDTSQPCNEARRVIAAPGFVRHVFPNLEGLIHVAVCHIELFIYSAMQRSAIAPFEVRFSVKLYHLI